MPWQWAVVALIRVSFPPIIGANKAIGRDMGLSLELPSGTYRVSELTSWVNAKQTHPIDSVPFAVRAQSDGSAIRPRGSAPATGSQPEPIDD